MINRKLLTAAALALAAGTSFAQDAVTHEQDRSANQEHRIQAGQADGSLTPHETRKLQKQQRKIAHAQRKAGADGVVTAREARHIDKMQDKASHDIDKQRHDGQTD